MKEIEKQQYVEMKVTRSAGSTTKERIRAVNLVRPHVGLRWPLPALNAGDKVDFEYTIRA